MKPKRIFSAREHNHLLKYGFDISDSQKYGDTPVEYVTGWAEFMDREFKVNQSTLIPRIETEDLVTLVINTVKSTFLSERRLVIADIGTGSGCIGLSLYLDLYKKFPKLEVFLSDTSSLAIAVCKENKKRLVPSPQLSAIKVLQSDLLLDYPDSVEIDIIVANLPYIPQQRLTSLDTSVIDFEPISALDGKDNKGLYYVNKLVEQAEKLVHRPFAIYQEIDEYVHKEDLVETKTYSSSIVKDSLGKTRFALFEKKELLK